MLIQFWCPSCRALHAPAEVEYAPDAGATPMAPPRCPRSGGPVELRAIPDDPDDERYELPHCPTCYGDVRPSSRFCTHCGAPLPAESRPRGSQPAGGTTPATEQGAVLPLVQFARQCRRRQQLARILSLLAGQDAQRRRPLPGDLPGDFDAWFDGGAVRYLTSLTEYHFADGSRASVHDLAPTKLQVELPDGALATIEEPPLQPSFADRVLAAVVAECGQILRSVQAEGPGRAPTQCFLVESERGGMAAQSWLYDLTANRLVPFFDAPVDMRDEPVDGMYFRRAMIQYSVVDERRALEFSCTLGPRFGRGLVFDLVEEAAGIRLANQRLLWIS
jgi:hypothetical protein